MKKFFSFLLTTFVLIGVLASTAPAEKFSGSLADALNEAGMQRARAYKLLKFYVQIQSKNRYTDPEAKFKKVSAFYEETQTNLKGYSSAPAIQEALKAVDSKWIEYKKHLARPCKSSEINGLLKESVELKMLSNKVVQALEKEAKGAGGEEVNRAGLFRAQSQKIALLYLIKSWEGSGDLPLIKAEMDKAMKSFKGSLDFLGAASHTTDEMKVILKKLKKTYLYFLVMNDSDVFTPTLVLKKTDAMLKDAVSLVNLYVKESKK
jgi:hypothetical protein